MDDRRVDVIREGFEIAVRGGAAVDPGLVGRRFASIRMVLGAHNALPALRAGRLKVVLPDASVRHRAS